MEEKVEGVKRSVFVTLLHVKCSLAGITFMNSAGIKQEPFSILLYVGECVCLCVCATFSNLE